MARVIRLPSVCITRANCPLLRPTQPNQAERCRHQKLQTRFGFFHPAYGFVVSGILMLHRIARKRFIVYHEAKCQPQGSAGRRDNLPISVTGSTGGVKYEIEFQGAAVEIPLPKQHQMAVWVLGPI